MARPRLLAAGALALALLTAGCSSDADNTAEPAAVTSAPAPMDEHTEGVKPIPTVAWNDQVKRDAADAAGFAISAFTDKKLEPADWWNQLASVLSEQAQHDYAGAAQENVPGTEVTGQPTAIQGASPYIAEATVPTDVGRYAVRLSRAEQGDTRWYVVKITLPESPHLGE